MTATTAGRASARAGILCGASSDALGPRDRPTPAHISGASSLGPLGAEFVERPRIFRRGGFGFAGDDDDRAVGLDLVARDLEAGFARLLLDAVESRLARLCLSACGAWEFR